MNDLAFKIRDLKNFFLRTDTPRVYEPLDRMIRAFQQSGGRERVLYFGDSVVERVSRDDVDKTPLGRMVADRLSPRYDTCVVTYSAYRPEMYLALSRVLAFTNRKPRIVILPVNLRCFSPQWDWNPKYDFKREVKAINRYCNDPEKKMIRLVPTNKVPVGFLKRRAYLRRRVNYPYASCRRIRDFVDQIDRKSRDHLPEDFRRRQIFIFHYLYSLEADHRQLGYLKTLLGFLFEMDIAVLAYLTPINYRAGLRYIGDDFRMLVSENVSGILQQMTGRSPEAFAQTIFYGPKRIVANWAFLLDDTFFFHRDEPTEHLNALGRKTLSDEIVRLTLCAMNSEAD